MAGYYDPNKDYSIAIEEAKKNNASAQEIKQLQDERANKIADKYGGNEPTMYGSNQTYSSLSANSGDYLTNKANQQTINNALAVGQSDASKAAYYAALAGDYDKAGTYINQMAVPKQYADGSVEMDMGNANDYWKILSEMTNYDAEEYYNRRYDEAFGKGSAAAFDATGGAIKTYAELVEKAGGADKAEQFLAAYQASAQPQSSPSNAMAGLAMATGQVASGGVNDMTKYLEELYAKNLEAELGALKSAYDSNVAELESQNDMIAEQYRAARNQAAAQNALEIQSMNERALATGLNTGTSGQLALAQNMAYQNNLGNLWAREAQDKAESDRMMAQMLRDYNAGVNQATATSNAKLAEALYNEMIRQEEMAAAAEAARIKQEQADREWLYKLEQDELDRQLQYAQLAAKNSPAAPKDMSLSTAKAMAKAGQLTDEVVAALLGEGYNAEYLASEYGYVPYGQHTNPTGTGNYNAILRDIVEASEAGGYSANKLIDMIDGYVSRGEISDSEAVEIARQFGLQ